MSRTFHQLENASSEDIIAYCQRLQNDLLEARIRRNSITVEEQDDLEEVTDGIPPEVKGHVLRGTKVTITVRQRGY